MLDELDLAGFTETYGPVGNEDARMLKRYRIADPFLRFYFTFIFPKRRQMKPAPLPLHQALPDSRFAIWRGLAFEHFCRQNTHALATVLGFSAVRYDCGPWFGRREMKSNAQVDLLFRRADQVLTLCEVKYRKTVGMETIAEMEKKVDVLLDSPLNRRKGITIEKVLVSVHPPASTVEREGYFSRILTFDDLLPHV